MDKKEQKITSLPRRTLEQMLFEFRAYWRNYIYQSLAATLATLIILVILTMENAVVVASIAASIFIVFAMPNAVSARKRAILGGHWVGLVCGSIWAIFPQPFLFVSILVYSLAVGTTMLVMVVFDVEHPPAAGTALGIAMTGFSWGVGTAIVSSTIVLILIRELFKPYLKDLV